MIVLSSIPRSMASRASRGMASTAVRRRWQALRGRERMSMGLRIPAARPRRARAELARERSCSGRTSEIEQEAPRSRVRRRRACLPRAGARPRAAGARARGGDRDLGEVARAGRGCRAALSGGRGVRGVPAATARRGAGSRRGGRGAAAAARRGAAPCRRQRHPDSGAVAGRRPPGGAAGDPRAAPLPRARDGDAVLRDRHGAAADRASGGGPGARRCRRSRRVCAAGSGS